MSLHLVTGYKGKAHITPSDHGAYNAGIIGAGEYVLNSGNKFAASVLSSNTVRILDGDLMIQGRHINLKKDTYEDITINNGTVGKNRNDLIVIRYTLDAASGVENAEFAVIQGEETSGTASDPKHTTGDILSGGCTLHEMPLYRIPLTGLTVGTPEPLFKSAGTMDNGLLFRGWNPITSISEDTPQKWRDLGTGIWMIDLANIITGQPSQWGFLYNTVCLEEVAQIFITQASGETYRRNANGSGWYGNDWKEGTWRKLFDEDTRPVMVNVYQGIGSFGVNSPNILQFNFKPKFVFISLGDYSLELFQYQTATRVKYCGESTTHNVPITWGENSVSWYTEATSSDAHVYQMNASGAYYHYIAIG